MPISSRSDPQLKRLYRWEENNGWDESTISFRKAKALIILACKVYKVEPPKVLLHTTRALPHSFPEENFISLQRDKYLKVPISLHEAAHHIVYKLYGARPQDHGPTFMGVYLKLLTKFHTNKIDGLSSNLMWYYIADAAELRWTD